MYTGLGFDIKYYEKIEEESANIKNINNLNANPLVKVCARYYLMGNFAVYLETGYDNSSILNLGVTIKL